MIVVTSFSEAGGHPENEDVFVVRHHPADPEYRLCFLADGQGGRAGGKLAAEIACRVGAEAAIARKPKDLTKPQTWPKILTQADVAVGADSDAGFTTLIGLCLVGTALIGDSAVMASMGGKRPVDLTVNQIKNPPVGSGMARFVPFSTSLISPWTVLVMSDGVWKYVNWERITEAISNRRGPLLVEALQAEARRGRSGQFPDDFTVIVFEGTA